eukprot:5973155-Pyramimonas_sp.AAC.2
MDVSLWAQLKRKSLVQRLSDGGDPPLFSRDALLKCVQQLSAPGCPRWFATNPDRILEYECVAQLW